MNILITGSRGQLGSEIMELSLEYDCFRFFFTDRHELDISNYSKIYDFCNEKKIQAIINCAAYTAVDKAEDEIYEAELINSTAISNIIKVVEELNIKLIHISTDYVFDGKSYVPYTEKDHPNPQNIYGKTKLIGERQVLNSFSQSIIIRTSWVYSYYGSNFVKTMRKLGAEKSSLNVVFDQIGTPTYAKDLAELCLLIMSKEEIIIDKNKIYHYSNEGVCSWYDFAKEIMSISNLECEIFPIESSEFPVKAKRPHFSILNKKLIKENFKIEVPYWKDSLKKCIIKLESN